MFSMFIVIIVLIGVMLCYVQFGIDVFVEVDTNLLSFLGLK